MSLILLQQHNKHTSLKAHVIKFVVSLISLLFFCISLQTVYHKSQKLIQAFNYVHASNATTIEVLQIDMTLIK